MIEAGAGPGPEQASPAHWEKEKTMIRKLLRSLNPVRALDAVDRWVARLDYQPRHPALAGA